MKTLTISLLLTLTVTPALGASKSPKTTQERCEELGEKMEMEQFKYHDTVARMTVRLRESSTPSIPIDLGKIQEHVNYLKKSKSKMNKLVKSKLYSTCF